MKKQLLLFVLVVNLFISNAQTTCKVVVGTIGSGDYDQLILSSYSPSSGNANWHEVLSFAWTCNGIGYPTCNYRTLMKYNLSSIPTNAIITSAKLKLFGETSDQDNGLTGQPMYGTANTSFLQKVTTPWNIATTGWSNPPSVNTITQKKLAQSVSSIQNYEIDMSDFVQSWVSDPTSNYGVMLRLQAENYYNSMIFYGGTSTVPEQYRPTLEICYTIPVSSCTDFVLKGTIGSGNYDQLILSSYAPSTGNPNWHEVLSFSWTCNAIGYTTCDYRTLMKYNLSSIPTNAIISSAKLKLVAEISGQDNGLQGQPMYGSANTSFLQKVTSSWNLVNTGWSNPPTIDINTQKILPQSTSSSQNYEVDVSDFVQSWVSDPTSNFGVMLRLQEENYYNSMIFYGGTNIVPEEYRPTLEICYNLSLPIVLKDLNGSINSGSAALSWNIVSDDKVKIRYIEVNRSLDGRTFSLISKIKGASNNNKENYYSFVDDQIPLTCKRVFYRLNLVDNNGVQKGSNIISFDIATKNINISISPNPVSSTVRVDYFSLNENIGEIKIIDMAGRIAYKNTYNLQKGAGSILLQDINIPNGMYLLKMKTQGSLITRKIAIQK